MFKVIVPDTCLCVCVCVLYLVKSIFISTDMHTLPSQPPVPMHYSEAHWSWVHLQWHLPSAVHDCGEICWNLQGTVLNGSHWSTFAWHCDWHSQSAYHGPGDRQTLIYRWDEVGWVWLIDRLSLSHWGITKPSLHTRRAILFWVWVCARVRVLMPLHHCVFMDGFVSVAGQPYTDYPSHLEHSDRYRIRLSAWPSLLLQRLAELNKLSGRDSDRRLPDKNHIHSIDRHIPTNVYISHIQGVSLLCRCIFPVS